MKYKLKPQTCLLVAGMVTAAYAQCFVAPTSGTTVCFYSGAQVDTITFNGGTKAVIATADWVKGKQNGETQFKNFLTAYLTATTGYNQLTGVGAPSYCFGAAKFTDPAGNTDTLPYWENGIVNGSPGVPGTPQNGDGRQWGNTNGVPCP